MSDAATATGAYYAGPGPAHYVSSAGTWPDFQRNRVLHYQCYRPRNNPAGAMLLYSHGLGASCTTAASWFAHWASWGLTVWAIQHTDTPGTPSKWMLRRALRTGMGARALAARQADLTLAIDQVSQQFPGYALGIAGHSLGSASVLRVLGECRGEGDQAPDRRVQAAILLSPSARGQNVPLAERFAAIDLPCLHWTGSLDGGLGTRDIRPQDRCLPFIHMPPPDKFLCVLADANHALFSGLSAGDAESAEDTVTTVTCPQQRRHQHLLRAGMLAFWRAYLCHDRLARHWLYHDFPALLTPADVWQCK